MKLLKKSVSLICLSLVFTMFLTACGNKPSNDKTSSENTGNTYPIKITDSYGEEVTINKRPEKIISLGPNTTEIVCALGAIDRLVGRTDFCDYPSDVSKIESIGTLYEPNIEKIVSLQPDLVVASTHTKEDNIKRLKELGIPVLSLYEKENFEGAYSLINKIGLAIDEKENAEKVVNDMKATVDGIKQKTANVTNKPKVYYMVDFGENGDFTAGGDTFINDIIEMAGGENIAKDITGWQYSFEKIVEKNPDVIICPNNFGTKDRMIVADNYKDLPAVKNNKVLELDDNLISREGPRLSQGLEEMAKLLHPELFK